MVIIMVMFSNSRAVSYLFLVGIVAWAFALAFFTTLAIKKKLVVSNSLRSIQKNEIPAKLIDYSDSMAYGYLFNSDGGDHLTQLELPTIIPGASSSVAAVSVTIYDSNPGGDHSEIMYRVDESPWKKYEGPFEIARKQKNDVVKVDTYASPIAKGLTKSEVASVNLKIPGLGFRGYTEAKVDRVTGRNPRHLRMNTVLNNGYLPPFDSSFNEKNPERLTELIEMRGYRLAKDYVEKMPKNSLYAVDGAVRGVFDIPNALLFQGSYFQFTSAGDEIDLGTFFYYNGRSVPETEIEELRMNLAVNLVDRIRHSVNLPLIVRFSHLGDGRMEIEFAADGKASIPILEADGQFMEVIPTFAYQSNHLTGTDKLIVPSGKAAFLTIKAKLKPMP